MIGTIALAAIAAGLLAFSAREHRLRRAAEAARAGDGRRRDRLFSDLAGALAHELRNPLNTLSLTFQFLERLVGREAARLEGGAAIEKHLGTAGCEVEKIKRAVEAFVELARPRELALEEVDLSALVTHAVELERVRRDGAVAAVELAVEAPPTPARVDRKEIEAAIVAVVANALEAVTEAPAADAGATSAGTSTSTSTSTKKRVEVACHVAESGRVEIVVRDSGAGFTERALSRIFEPYFSTKPDHAGLGLARARLIVEAHGGRVGAANRAPAGGAEVRIELPAAAAGSGPATRG